jgi:hypothetical protein
MPVKIFICYTHEDEQLLNTLKNELIPLNCTFHSKAEGMSS